MRRARLKPDQQDHYYHVYNRIVGLPCEMPFGRVEKEKFLRILRRLAAYYVIDVIAYQVMSNHYHLVVHVPRALPSPDETCARYREYYRGKRSLSPESGKCEELRYMLRDLSCFMHDLQQQFTTWFNKTRSTGKRRGGLWSGRFKSTLLQEGRAVRTCIIYTQMNPVRAGIVKSPADYRFGSWGYWCATGHPFGESPYRALLHCFSDMFRDSDVRKIKEWLDSRYRCLCAGHGEEQTHSRGIVFTMRTDRRVRYWAESLAIGSELFVLEALRGVRILSSKHLVRSEDCHPGEAVLWTYPRLRYISA